MRKAFALPGFVLLVLACAGLTLSAKAAQPLVYVGTKACVDCHPSEYDSYNKNSKKAHSFKSVQIMSNKLEPSEVKECYACHTTGYKQPGGFESLEKTPDMANGGCEVCHGPGSAHVTSGGDTKLIKGKLTVDDCKACHSAERVRSFNYRPMIYGGGH
jgi:hypothetical protein